MLYKVTEEAYCLKMSPCSLAFYFIYFIFLKKWNYLYLQMICFFNSHLRFMLDNMSVLFDLPVVKGNLCLSWGISTIFLCIGLVEQAQGVAVCSVGTQTSTGTFGARLLISKRFSLLCYKRRIITTVSAPNMHQIFNNKLLLNKCENYQKK